MKLLNIFKSFKNDESGAVTVDWVVLTAAIVGLGLMLLAAMLRVLIEVVCMVVHALQPARGPAVRDALEWFGRVVFYVGVPTWLVLRLIA